MAEIEGTQDIPASWLGAYRGALREQDPGDKVFKRYPFKLPVAQGMGHRIHTKQLEQRSRFISAASLFGSIDESSRSRWYDAMPIYNSLLWYYNYFMLSALNGLAGTYPQGAGVIKNIQNLVSTLGTDGGTFTMPTSVDPKKCVVMIWGGGVNHSYTDLSDTTGAGWAWVVYPIWSNLSSLSVEVNWSMPVEQEAIVSCQVIEYI